MSKVISFGVGTLAVGGLCAGAIGACLLGGAMIIARPLSHQGHTLSVPYGALSSEQAGSIGEAIKTSAIHPESREAVEAYGPLNRQALAETKQSEQ